MSLLERLDVPAAKSRFSISATVKPRAAASSATPQPVTPPPITRTSKVSAARRVQRTRVRLGTQSRRAHVRFHGSGNLQGRRHGGTADRWRLYAVYPVGDMRTEGGCHGRACPRDHAEALRHRLAARRRRPASHPVSRRTRLQRRRGVRFARAHARSGQAGTGGHLRRQIGPSGACVRVPAQDRLRRRAGAARDVEQGREREALRGLHDRRPADAWHAGRSRRSRTCRLGGRRPLGSAACGRALPRHVSGADRHKSEAHGLLGFADAAELLFVRLGRLA